MHLPVDIQAAGEPTWERFGLTRLGLAVEWWTVGHPPSGSIRSKSNSRRVFNVPMGQGLLCGGWIRRDGPKVVKRCGFSATRSTTPFRYRGGGLVPWFPPTKLRTTALGHGLRPCTAQEVSHMANEKQAKPRMPAVFSSSSVRIRVEGWLRGCQFGYTEDGIVQIRAFR